MKKIITLTLMMLAFSVSLFAADLKIAVVDTKAAVDQTEDGKKAQKNIEDYIKSKQKKITKMEEDLQKMRDDFQKKSAVLSDDIKMQKQQELQAEFAKYQQFAMESQKEMQKKQQEVYEPIFKKMRKVIDGFASKQKYDVILDKNAGVVFANDAVDITDKIVKAYQE